MRWPKIRWLPPTHVLQYDWLVHAMTWMPLILLVALFFEGASIGQWLQGSIIVLLGVGLWYGGLWVRFPWNLVVYASFGVLGLWSVTLHWAGAVYFFYAVVFLMPLRRLWHASLALMGLVALVAIQGVWLELGGLYLAIVLLLIIVNGHGDYLIMRHLAIQAQLVRSQEQTEYWIRETERERIARDLHDVLGHRLSSIALQAELAGKLVPRDPDRARQTAMSVSQAAREALAEVRQTVTGYRSGSLAAEFSLAEHALSAAAIEVSLHTDAAEGLPREQENALGLALREAITNVIRHAGAKHCKIAFQAQNPGWKLSVEDDGCGWNGQFGNGLAGMKERLRLCFGQLSIRSLQPGCRLEIRLQPMPEEPAL